MRFSVFFSYILTGLLLTLPPWSGSAQGLAKDNISDGERVVPIYDFDGLQPLLHADSDTTWVVNFWATWCAPCVEELPYFEELTREYADKPLRVLLVSLDFRRQLERRLLPFLKNNDIQSRVVVLDDADANAWIDKVDPSWSGAIPATLFYQGERRLFKEQTFTRDELFQLVQTFTE
jgi:thiol-disulfide isomerase/thioredoxin